MYRIFGFEVFLPKLRDTCLTGHGSLSCLLS
jgi:hypothetical protein